MFKDSLVYGVTGAGSRFVAILLVPIYTRIFPPNQYGLLDLLITSSTLLVLISGMQVESGIARNYFEAKKIGEHRKLIGVGIALYIVGVGIWIVISGFVFQTWLYGLEGLTWEFILPLLLGLLPTQFLILWLLILRLDRRPALFSVISIGDIFSSGLLSILAVVVLGMGIPGVLWSVFISKLVWSAIGYRMLREDFPVQFNMNYAKQILTYGVPLVPSVIAKWAQNFANRFVLVATLTLAQVGTFSLAVKIATAVALIDTAFRQAWLPYALEIMGKAGSKEEYSRMLDFYLVGMLGISAGVGALGWLIVKLLATEAYFSAARLVGFVAIGLLWNGSLQILEIGISFVRKTYWIAIGFALGATINLLLLWFTVREWGLLAAGYSYVLGTLTTAIVILTIAQRLYHIPYRYPVIGAIIAASVFFPIFFYLFPAPDYSIGSVALSTAYRIAITSILWIALAVLLIKREQRRKLLNLVSSIFRERVRW